MKSLWKYFHVVLLVSKNFTKWNLGFLSNLPLVIFGSEKVKTGQTFEPTTPNISSVPWSPKRSATMLETFAQLFHQCWVTHAHYTWSPYKVLWIVSFPRCTAGPNNVGSCCVRLHLALRSVHKSMTIMLMIVQSSFHSELTDSHTFGGWNRTAGILNLFKLRVGGTWIS